MMKEIDAHPRAAWIGFQGKKSNIRCMNYKVPSETKVCGWLKRMMMCDCLSGYFWLKQDGFSQRAPWHAGNFDQYQWGWIQQILPLVIYQSRLRNARKRMLHSSTLLSLNFFSRQVTRFNKSNASTMFQDTCHDLHYCNALAELTSA